MSTPEEGSFSDGPESLADLVERTKGTKNEVAAAQASGDGERVLFKTKIDSKPATSLARMIFGCDPKDLPDFPIGNEKEMTPEEVDAKIIELKRRFLG